MCGIAGILGRRGDVAASLSRMQAALRHRGPDDEGMWTSPGHGAAFTHTRLAVIDPTPAGHQPMTTPDGRFTITFSGEIYNFRQLRQELESTAVFRTRTDTEVILHGLSAHGSAFVSRLRGMFAFAVWDESEQTCLLARDAFGLKPLYLHHAPDGSVIFASELRALMASKSIPVRVDPNGLHGYLRSGSVPEPFTLIDQVRAVPAGHVMTWRAGRISTRAYWSVRFRPDASTNHHSETVRQALTDSIAHHFVSDVPVGVFLSGGVDSAAVLALAKQSGVGEVRTISMTLPGSAADESDLARKTAQRFGAVHSEVAIDAVAARDLFPHYLAAIDQPSIDGFNTFVVSRFARQQGLKVALSGIGADEIFGGYGSFTRVPQMTSWNEQLSWTGPIRSLGGRMLEYVARDPRWRRVGELLQQPPALSTTHRTFRGIFTRRESQRIAASFGVDAPFDDAAEPEEEAASVAADEVSRLELTRYVRNQLVRDSDTASMAAGLELRAPFLDTVLFDAVARIPAPVRLAADKRLLRDAVAELPAWVMGPKRCFQFPFDDWAAREWRPLFDEADACSPVPTGTWYRKLSLIVLTHWMERMKSNG